MSTLKTFIACTFGPRVNKFYKLSGHTLAASTPQFLSATHKYTPNQLESIPDNILRLFGALVGFSPYISIVLFPYAIYNPKSLEMKAALKWMATAFSVFMTSLLLRGYGRFKNVEYLSFLKFLQDATNNYTFPHKRILNNVDFEFKAHPIDFKWKDSPTKHTPAYPHELTQNAKTNSKYATKPPMYANFLFKLIADIAMWTVGKRLVYPGTIGALQSMMSPAITAGRERLINNYYGVRYKLLTNTGDHIDSLFIDKRDSTPNGKYLVVGCEGNGGFYEVGTIFAPLEAGYSVLGWNHPGFGGSSGFPYPNNEASAIDTVMKLAIEKFKFPIDKIIVHGWSIGGYTATWAAMRYPKIYALVVDASFDHILPIARNVVPFFIRPIADLAIGGNFDLNNSMHLEFYRGPILLIRRTQDEVISLDPSNPTATNRANDLLIHVMEQRYPFIMDDKACKLVRDYLDGNDKFQNSILRRFSVETESCLRDLKRVADDPDKLDNVTKNKIILFLASTHLVDFDSVHCAPLPPRYYEILHARIENMLKISKIMHVSE